ncbi:MAG: hypothetical protein IJK07_04875 [Bacteroidales bacterium]|nr:hypothetical protein [Bacteroidales bacterium]
MSEYQHTGLANGRWTEMSLAEQMLNIGSEVSRANRWKSKGNTEQCHRAADRALELLSLTIDAQRGKHDLGEFCRLYEVMADCYYGDNIYHTDPAKLQRGFDVFYNTITPTHCEKR